MKWLTKWFKKYLLNDKGMSNIQGVGLACVMAIGIGATSTYIYANKDAIVSGWSNASHNQNELYQGRGQLPGGMDNNNLPIDPTKLPPGYSIDPQTGLLRDPNGNIISPSLITTRLGSSPAGQLGFWDQYGNLIIFGGLVVAALGLGLFVPGLVGAMALGFGLSMLFDGFDQVVLHNKQLDLNHSIVMGAIGGLSALAGGLVAKTVGNIGMGFLLNRAPSLARYAPIIGRTAGAIAGGLVGGASQIVENLVNGTPPLEGVGRTIAIATVSTALTFAKPIKDAIPTKPILKAAEKLFDWTMNKTVGFLSGK